MESVDGQRGWPHLATRSHAQRRAESVTAGVSTYDRASTTGTLAQLTDRSDQHLIDIHV